MLSEEYSSGHTVTRFAHQNGVDVLYRFFAYPPEDEILRGRVDAVIDAGEIYFPTMLQFNDPFEGRPRFRPADTDEKTRYAMIKHLRNKVARQKGYTKRDLENEEKRILKVDLHEQIAAFAAIWHEKFSKYPMSCLCADYRSILMWSYYAGGHTGVAIHFDAKKVPWGLAQQVLYSEQYPELPIPFGEMSEAEVVSRCILTKALCWSHESEYRLINYPGDDGSYVFDGILKRKTEQIATIPTNTIVGVTLGARSKDGPERRKLVRRCRE